MVVLEDIMSIPDSSLRKRLGYEVLSFSLQAHSLSQDVLMLDIFFADDLFKYESVYRRDGTFKVKQRPLYKTDRCQHKN